MKYIIEILDISSEEMEKATGPLTPLFNDGTPRRFKRVNLLAEDGTKVKSTLVLLTERMPPEWCAKHVSDAIKDLFFEIFYTTSAN